MTAIVAILGAPILLPLLGLRVGYETWARALGWPIPRRRGWVRVWWFYGYHLGLYRLDWWLKERAAPGARASGLAAAVAEASAWVATENVSWGDWTWVS